MTLVALAPFSIRGGDGKASHDPRKARQSLGSETRSASLAGYRTTRDLGRQGQAAPEFGEQSSGGVPNVSLTPEAATGVGREARDSLGVSAGDPGRITDNSPVWVDSVAEFVSKSGVTRLLPSRGPLIVMYHGIGGADGIPPRDLIVQLELLRARRTVVPLRELGDRLADPSASGLAAITFDDGYVDFAEIAVPALRRLGLHATLFVPAGLIGRSNSWDAGIATTRRILDARELRELDPGVVEIGGHGLTHSRMAGLAADALERETAGCRGLLEDTLGRSIDLFAYPYGQRDDFDAAAESAVARAGFLLACSTCFGRANGPPHRYRLHRVGIEPRDDLGMVQRKLEGAYDWVRWKEATGYRVRMLRRAR